MKAFIAKYKLEGGSWFLALFCIWIIAGAIVLCVETDKAIYLFVNTHHTPFLDTVMPYVTYLGTAPVIAFLLLLLLWRRNFRNGKFLLLALVCNLIPFLLVQLLKNVVHRPRPLYYFKNASGIHLVAGQPQLYHLSFPSGHSEGIFALCCFLALLLPRKYAYGGIFLLFAGLVVIYSRVYLSQHFFSDVYGGSIVGVLGALAGFIAVRYGFDKWAFNKKRLQNA